MLDNQPATAASPKSAVITLLLCVFFGMFGAHRFYTGRFKSGIAMLLTLGGLGLWMIFDTVLIACSEFTDSEDRPLVLAQRGAFSWKWLFALLSICASICIVLVMICLGCMFFYPRDGVMRTVQDQLAAIREGNLDKAYTYGSDAFQQATSLDEFTQFVNGYDAIKNNQDIIIKTHEISNEGGELIGVVYSKNDSLPIDYKLIVEDGKYKIQNIDVSPGPDADNTSVDKESAAAKYLTYNDTVGNYSINYPDTWYHESQNKYSVVFSGKKGSPEYISTVIVQVIPMQKLGGIYASAQDVVNDLQDQIKKDAVDVKFEKNGQAESSKNKQNYKGLYFIVSYTYKDIPMRKMQFIIVTPDKKYAYSWGYTTTDERYNQDLPIAKAMYESFEIKPPKS